jgi:hypothetical protein
MKIIISCEPFSLGIRSFHDGKELSKKDINISDSLWMEYRTWYKLYEPFNSMTLEELSIYWDKIDELDSKGIELTKMLASQWFPDDVEKIFYFSICRDRFLLEITGKSK